MKTIDIANGLGIPEDSFIMTASRSSGPGGQYVNKTSTRVTISLDVVNCESLPEKDRHRILNFAGKRASSQGIIRVSCQNHRSQLRNREEAMNRLINMLKAALRPARERKLTIKPSSAVIKRLEVKKRRSETKKLRSRVE